MESGQVLSKIGKTPKSICHSNFYQSYGFFQIIQQWSHSLQKGQVFSSQMFVALSKEPSWSLRACNRDCAAGQVPWAHKLKINVVAYTHTHTPLFSLSLSHPLLFFFLSLYFLTSVTICHHHSQIPWQHYCSAIYSFFPHLHIRGFEVFCGAPTSPPCPFPLCIRGYNRFHSETGVGGRQAWLSALALLLTLWGLGLITLKLSESLLPCLQNDINKPFLISLF